MKTTQPLSKSVGSESTTLGSSKPQANNHRAIRAPTTIGDPGVAKD